MGSGRFLAAPGARVCNANAWVAPGVAVLCAAMMPRRRACAAMMP